MNTYTVGARVFCDYHFGGKPRGKVVEVLEPGTGKSNAGRVRVQLTETVGAYRKGEIVELSTFYAVPVKQEFRKSGSVFRWVDTCYEFVKSSSPVPAGQSQPGDIQHSQGTGDKL